MPRRPPPSPRDTVTHLTITNVRGIKQLQLDLKGLSVLIGDNGSGKSTILEALELLRQAAHPVNYIRDVLSRHGGLESIVRHGENSLTLAVRIEGGGPAINYEFRVGYTGSRPIITNESLQVQVRPNKWIEALERTSTTAHIHNLDSSGAEEVKLTAEANQKLMVSQFGIEAPKAFARLKNALEKIDYQAPFETRPLWQQADSDAKGPRWPAPVEEVDALSRYGTNLAICFLELKNSGNKRWSGILERIQLGLGEDFADFQTKPVGRGKIELRAIFRSAPDHPVPAEFLSDGQLAYLCFVALTEMNRGRSLLAFDEPEVHLHPGLLTRVIWLLEEMAKHTPVVLATHSDKLLDALLEPAKSVVLCQLDSERAVSIQRPDQAALNKWLEDYRGIGEIRTAGYEKHIFPDPQS